MIVFGRIWGRVCEFLNPEALSENKNTRAPNQPAKAAAVCVPACVCECAWSLLVRVCVCALSEHRKLLHSYQHYCIPYFSAVGAYTCPAGREINNEHFL